MPFFKIGESLVDLRRDASELQSTQFSKMTCSFSECTDCSKEMHVNVGITLHVSLNYMLDGRVYIHRLDP